MPLAKERLHITLHDLGLHDGVPPGIVADACRAAANVTMPPFDVTFDHVLSFCRGAGKKPIVLCGSGEGLMPLKAFRQTLGVELTKVGLGSWVKSGYTPHVTLLYDNLRVARETIDPIRWTVREFVLVHSIVGETKHIHLARWPLRG